MTLDPSLQALLAQPIASAPAQNSLSLDQAFLLAQQHQAQGRLPQAESLLRQILQARPQHAHALHLLGVIAHQCGKPELALELITQAIAVRKDVALFHANLAEMARQQGLLDRAIASGKQAAALDPLMASAHGNLGLAHYDNQQLDEAEACQQRALALDPSYAPALNNLGSIERDRGNSEAALAWYRKANFAAPDYIDPLSNIGAVLLEQEEPEQARDLLEQALRLNPNHAEAACNMGMALIGMESYKEAQPWLQRALQVRPNYTEAHLGMAVVAIEAEAHEAAMQHVEQARALQPAQPKVLSMLGAAYREIGQDDHAREMYRAALAMDADHKESLTGMGQMCMEDGDLHEAERLLRKAIALYPDNFPARFQLTQVHKTQAGDDNLAALETIELEKASPEKQISLHFALGKCYDDIKDYDKAFPHYLAGCKLKREKFDYDAGAAAKQFSEFREIFSKEFIGSLRGSGDPSATPIFVLGMPRSGTTLTEQIIASHPDVFGAGELPDLLRIAHRKTHPDTTTFPENLLHLDAKTLTVWGKEYITGLRTHAPAAKHITDKMPANFFAVPLIHLMLPNAKIIHVNRNPVDTCVSCFTRLFRRKQEHTYDLAELGRYYADYARLMDHWRAVLPADAFYEVQYEAIVADQEGEARKLLAYCGLEWNDACLDFHKTQRQVRTASVVQVRQPIYTSSVERWRKYEKHLGPLLDALGEWAPRSA